MPGTGAILKKLETDNTRSLFAQLYGNDAGVLAYQNGRYTALLQRFEMSFPGESSVELFSTPGRTEVGGNHTDHNGGMVLAAAVNLDVIAAAAPSDDGIITVMSEGFPPDRVDTAVLEPIASERFNSAALIRGICARMKQLGFNIGGFKAVTTSSVLKGSGLSSSAAFEVLMASILNHLYNGGKMDDVLLARISQFAENNFFGKPCGLMDQIACAVGGFVTIDFRDFEKPAVRKVDFDFTAAGYSLVIIDTGGDHAHLNEDYAELEQDMKSAAAMLGGKVLRDCTRDSVFDNAGLLREKVNDRAILRAVHFFDENQRVQEEVAALEKKDFKGFLKLVNESGQSSWMLCQNCYTSRDTSQQGITLAQTLTRDILGDRGAWRVHGGGFAGTVQVFVPNELAEEYMGKMRAVYGPGSCHKLSIRPTGQLKLDISGTAF